MSFILLGVQDPASIVAVTVLGTTNASRGHTGRIVSMGLCRCISFLLCFFCFFVFFLFPSFFFSGQARLGHFQDQQVGLGLARTSQDRTEEWGRTIIRPPLGCRILLVRSESTAAHLDRVFRPPAYLHPSEGSGWWRVMRFKCRSAELQQHLPSAVPFHHALSGGEHRRRVSVRVASAQEPWPWPRPSSHPFHRPSQQVRRQPWCSWCK